jgi:sugar/nucleoside kinase (ribokinase family)
MERNCGEDIMPNTQYDVLAVGNAIVDIMRRCDETLLAKIGGPKGHMSLVANSASIAAIYNKMRGGIEVAGGAAANTAVGVVSLGGRAAFIGKVADDELGRIFRHDIRSAGVTFTAAPTVAPGKETSRSLILVTPDGQRTMYTFLGCSTELDDHLIDAATIEASRIVFLEGYLFDRPEARAAFRRAVALANAAGKLVALSLSDSLCVERHRPEFLRLIHAGIGVLFANESEIMALYEAHTFEDAMRQAGHDLKLVVLTRSEKGSVIVANGEAMMVPPQKVSKVVDATGAGDLYAAGFLYALSHGMNLKAAGELGSFAAAEIIGVVGARPEVRLSHSARLRGFLGNAGQSPALRLATVGGAPT